jgi:uncharacterized protein with ATP-grasp and redox domains
MATIIEEEIEFKVSKDELKLLALRFVQSWSSLNINDLEEDFYIDVMVSELKNNKDTRILDFTVQEKEIMRKEFITINNWLTNRRIKLLNRINSM